jgi:hypothetical protein
MAFNGKYAGRLVQLLADVFVDALEGAAAWAVSVVRLMMDQGAWKLWRQSSALGFLLFLGRRWHCLQRLKLCFNRCDIGIDKVIEQTGLIRIHLLAALGKLQTLELGDLVGQFLDQRLVAVDLLAHGLNGFTHRFDRLAQRIDLVVECLDTLHQLRRQGAQLFRGQVIEIG